MIGGHSEGGAESCPHRPVDVFSPFTLICYRFNSKEPHRDGNEPFFTRKIQFKMFFVKLLPQ